MAPKTKKRKKAKETPDAKTESKDRFMALDRFFRIPPVSRKSLSGAGKVTLEHRMGPEGGTSLNEQTLFERVGFEKELMSRGVKLEKSFTNRKLFDEFFEAMHRRYKARLRSWVRSYRAYLGRLYQPQEFKPVFGYVPTDDFKKPVLMIAGFIDVKTLAPVAGDLELITRALELKNVHLQPLVDEYQENRQIAKRMLTLSGVNKDLQHRLGQVVAGNVAKVQLIERYET